MISNRPEIVAGQLQLTKHFPLGFGIALGTLLVGDFRSGWNHHVVGHERLELDGIGPGIGGGIHELAGELDVTIMIDARLGDDQARLPRSDFAMAELDGFHPGTREKGTWKPLLSIPSQTQRGHEPQPKE